MPRPTNPNPPVNVHIMVPKELYGKVQALLFSPTEGRVPLGAISAFFTQAAERHVEAIIAAAAQE